MNLKLTPFFKEVIEKRWSEFAKMEHDDSSHTSAQAVVFAIVRACAKGKLPAIKESLNRIDGKLQEQIEVEYPKFYIQYPHAKEIASAGASTQKSLAAPADIEPENPDLEAPLVTGSLRDTLNRMADAPKVLVDTILKAADDVDARKSYDSDVDPINDPLVKSVIVAGLLKMAHNGSLSAIFEVFDNLDGKLVDKIKVLGEDVYLTNYDEIAPAGATKNKDGIYEIQADNTTSSWAISLERKGVKK
jgi:hypothetical protein